MGELLIQKRVIFCRRYIIQAIKRQLKLFLIGIVRKFNQNRIFSLRIVLILRG